MHDSPQVSPEYKSLSSRMIEELPKVVLNHRVSPNTITAELKALAADRVVYAELLVEVADQAELDGALAALETPLLDARLILSAPHGGEVATVTKLVAENYGPKVVGFNLSGVDDAQLASVYAGELSELRRNFIPFSVELGEEAEVTGISDAVLQGAVRLGNGIRIFEDFSVDIEGIHLQRMSAWVRDRKILLAMAPTLAVDAERPLVDHPLPLLQELGFTCAVHPGTGSLSAELDALRETFDYGIDEIFELCLSAVDNSFAPQQERDEILAHEILPAYRQFEDSDLHTTAGGEEEAEQ